MVVKIDYSKCMGPIKCGKCLAICPLKVFLDVPEGKFKPYREPENRRVVPYYDALCNSCNSCVKICPKKCIFIFLK